MNYEGYIEFPFRVDHDGFGQKPILIMLENRDPELWQVELLFEQAERVGDFEDGWYSLTISVLSTPGVLLRIESPLLPREPRSAAGADTVAPVPGRSLRSGK